MQINQPQIQAVLALSGPERYRHFIKVVTDWEEVWGLYKDGWALAGADDGDVVFPLWPAKEYAQLCAQGSWEDYEPSSLSLDELVNELLPRLKKDNVLPGVFYTPNDKGVTPEVDQLVEDINDYVDENFL